VARYIARSSASIRPTSPGRKPAVQPREDDHREPGGLRGAAYTINDKRKQIVDFAGPYFTVGQDLLVRQDDDSITGPQSLNGKKLCSWPVPPRPAVKDKFAQGATLVEYTRYSDCVTGLLAHIVDAVTTDDVILAVTRRRTRNCSRS